MSKDLPSAAFQCSFLYKILYHFVCCICCLISFPRSTTHTHSGSISNKLYHQAAIVSFWFYYIKILLFYCFCSYYDEIKEQIYTNNNTKEWQTCCKIKNNRTTQHCLRLSSFARQSKNILFLMSKVVLKRRHVGQAPGCLYHSRFTKSLSTFGARYSALSKPSWPQRCRGRRRDCVELQRGKDNPQRQQQHKRENLQVLLVSARRWLLIYHVKWRCAWPIKGSCGR